MSVRREAGRESGDLQIRTCPIGHVFSYMKTGSFRKAPRVKRRLTARRESGATPIRTCPVGHVSSSMQPGPSSEAPA